MHPRLDELVTYLDIQRDVLLAAPGALPRERWRLRPGAGRWSVVDVLEHLHRVEKGVARLIAKRAAEGWATGLPRESESGSVLGALDGRGVASRTVKLIAPPAVDAVESRPPEEALARLEESRRALRQAIAEADGLALARIRHPHPVLGEIDLYQWILFVGQHEARHAEQVAETAAALTSTPVA